MRKKPGIFASVVTMAALLAPASAGATTHPSAFSWSTTSAYAASTRWELDSPNGVYRAIWQGDHNFVVYHGGNAIWASHTDGVAADSLYFTSRSWNGFKGAVAVGVYCTSPCSYSAGTKQWTNGVDRAYASYHVNMQNDGNFVEYSGTTGGIALWATNTAGK